MILYFETKPNASGNKLQLTINTETGEAVKGFFLFAWNANAVKLDRAQLEKLFNQAREAYTETTQGGANR